MAFDVNGALQAGYSLDDIGQHIGFDVKKARESGYSDDEIKSYLAQTEKPQSKPMIDTSLLDDKDTMKIDTSSISQSPSEDTQTTIGDLNQVETNEKENSSDFVKDFKYSAKQVGMGIMSDFAGLNQWVMDMIGLIPGVNDTQFYQEAQESAQQTIKWWNNASKELAKREGYSEDSLLSPNNLGRLSLLFGAPTTGAVGTAALINGLLAYAEARGEGETVTSSLVDAALNAGLTAGTMKTFDYLTVPASAKVVRDLKKKLNLSDDQVKAITKEYQTIMDDTGHNAEVKAMLWYAGKNKLNIGTKYVTKVANESPKAAEEVERSIMARKEALKDMVRTKYNDITDFAQDIAKVEQDIKADYGNFVDDVKGHTIVNPLTKHTDDIPTSGPEWEALSDNLKSDLYKIKQLSTKEEVTAADLIDAYKSVNKLSSSPTAKGTSKGHYLHQIKEELQKNIKNILSKDEYETWNKLNKDYSTFLTYKQSKLGQIIDQTIGNNPKTGTYTVDSFLSKLPHLTESVDTFRAIRELVGTEKSVKLENYLIDSILNRVDDYNWARLKDMLGKKGFVSENGQTLQRLMNTFEKNFKVDQAYTKALADIELKEGSKTTVEDMLKALGVKAIARMLVKSLPNETGKEARLLSRLTKILEQPSNVKRIEEAMENMSVAGRQRILNEVVKQIEYKPDTTTKVVDNTIHYVTPGGKAIPQQTSGTATKVSKAVLTEHQDQLIKDFIAKSLPNVGKDETAKVYKYFENYNFDKILKEAREQLDDVEFKKWSSVYNKIVKNKVEDLVNKIENDVGLKLPKSEVENLYKREWKKDIILNSPRYEEFTRKLSKIIGKDKDKALNSIKDELVRESKQLAKKLKVSDEEAFKLLLEKLKRNCK